VAMNSLLNIGIVLHAMKDEGWNQKKKTKGKT